MLAGRVTGAAARKRQRVLQPNGLRACLDDGRPMRQAIDDGPAQARVGKHARPLSKRQIGRDHDGSALLAFAQDAKQQLGAVKDLQERYRC